MDVKGAKPAVGMPRAFAIGHPYPTSEDVGHPIILIRGSRGAPPPLEVGEG